MHTSIYHELARARLLLAEAQRNEKIARALAESEIIAGLNGNLGKNEAERARQLTIGLAGHTAYRATLAHQIAHEERLALLEADMDAYRDARRQEEWSIRAELVAALQQRGLPTDHTDESFDDVADEAVDADATPNDEETGMSGGSLESDWYAQQPRPRPNYAMLADDLEVPF